MRKGRIRVGNNFRVKLERRRKGVNKKVVRVVRKRGKESSERRE